jgi:shikimate kinase
VIALGGGAAQDERAWRILRRTGVTVLLTAEPEELIRRIGASGRPIQERPMLAGGDPVDRLRELNRTRRRYYARADLHLDTEGLGVEAAAAAALGLLRGLEGDLAKRSRHQPSSRRPGSSAPDGEA